VNIQQKSVKEKLGMVSTKGATVKIREMLVEDNSVVSPMLLKQYKMDEY